MLGPFLTYLDAAVLAVALISGLLAMYRGLTRELLSISSWIAALAAAVYFVFYHKSTAEEIARQFQAPVAVAQIVVGGIIFLIVLIIVHLITSRLSDTILDSRVGIIDRILGLVFGAARGFIIFVILYMFYVQFFAPAPNTQAEWISRSASLPYLQSVGQTLQEFLMRVLPEDGSFPTPPRGGQPG